MTCETITLADGTTVITCSRGKRWPRCSAPGCDRPAPFLCDYPVQRKRGAGTCDAKLCEGHRRMHQPADATQPLDYCPAHASAAAAFAAGVRP